MPQGKFKTKIHLPKGVSKQKQNSHKKPFIRKGHLSIAPKKSKLVEVANFKKGLEKAAEGKHSASKCYVELVQGLEKQLKASIEQEAVSRASNVEPKQLYLLKAAKELSTGHSSKMK